ncbi:MAG TPA: beta-galactosidase [Planctomycetota bacterium]|jgi:hypothetical protein
MIKKNLWGGVWLPVAALAIVCVCLAAVSGCGGSRREAAVPAVRTRVVSTLDLKSAPPVELADSDNKPAVIVPDPASPQIVLLQPSGADSSATVCGRITGLTGSAVGYRLLWVDGFDRVMADWPVETLGGGKKIEKKASAEAPVAESISFALKQPACCLGTAQRLMLVKMDEARLSSRQKDGANTNVPQDGADANVPPYKVEAQATFLLPQAQLWRDYSLLLEGGAGITDPAFWKVLPELGISGGGVAAQESGGRWILHGMPFYSEALPDEGHPFRLGKRDELLKAYAKSRDAKGCLRQPPLFDEAALASGKLNIQKSVLSKQGLLPQAWSIGESLSLTHENAPFEYDMSPETLAIFRNWLQDKYSKLYTLNETWGTHYLNWEQVRPISTDETKATLNPRYALALAQLNPSFGPKPATETIGAAATPPPVKTPGVEKTLPKGLVPVPVPGTEKPAPAAEKSAPKGLVPAPGAEKSAPTATGGVTPATPPVVPPAKIEERDGLSGFVLAADEAVQPGKENFAAWCDWREFNNFAFSRVLREYRSYLNELGGPAQVGLLDAQPPLPWGGWDWWQLARTLDWAEEHDSVLARELLNSMGRSASRTRAPGLSDVSGARLLSRVNAANNGDIYRVWDRWLRGDYGCILPKPESWLKAPEYQPAAEVQPLLADLQAFTQGLTLLRETASRASDPVAIYYSPRSMELHWLLDSEADGAFWLKRTGAEEAKRSSALLDMNAWHVLLEDLGLSPRFISSQQAVAGELSSQKIKVLILPKVLSISDAEARALREFAKNGGIVIADGACGTFDGTGSRVLVVGKLAGDPRPVGVLDRDFGIARKDLKVLECGGAYSGGTREACVRMKDASTGQATGPEGADLKVLEPGISTLGAWNAGEAAMGAPALISKRAGAGRFMYLNLAMQDYPALRLSADAAGFEFHDLTAKDYEQKFGQPTGGEALRLVIGDILAEALGESALRVRKEDGTAPRGLRRVRYALGERCSLYALMPLASETAGGLQSPLKEKLPLWVGEARVRHWYDVRAGKYLGVGQMVQAEVEPLRATMLAALPYSVDRLSVKVRRTDQRGKFKLNAVVVAKGGSPGKHIFHVEVYAPSGERLPHYAKNVIAEDGQWNYELALGLNEPLGTYRMVLRDVVSGVTAEASLLKDYVEYSGVR